MEITNEPRNADAPRAGEGLRLGLRGEGGKQGAPDFDALWERMKDRVPPGTTKEDFIKRAKERMATGGSKSAKAAPAEGGTARYIQPGSLVYKGDLALLPGMTANVSIVANQRQDVLRVPSVALRFNPLAFVKAKPEAKTDATPAQNPGTRPSAPSGGLPAKGMVSKREDRIWILENGSPKALPVKAGISDGQFTEISGENLSEGLVVLTGVEDTKKAATQATPIGGPGGRR